MLALLGLWMIRATADADDAGLAWFVGVIRATADVSLLGLWMIRATADADDAGLAWFVGVIRATADAGLVGLVDDWSDG